MKEFQCLLSDRRRMMSLNGSRANTNSKVPSGSLLHSELSIAKEYCNCPPPPPLVLKTPSFLLKLLLKNFPYNLQVQTPCSLLIIKYNFCTCCSCTQKLKESCRGATANIFRLYPRSFALKFCVQKFSVSKSCSKQHLLPSRDMNIHILHMIT